jgi:hypothetical protein
MEFFGSEKIQIVRKTAGIEDPIFGKKKGSTEYIDVNGVFVAWGSSSTNESLYRTTLQADVTFYLPSGTKVLDGDNFLYRGEHWEKVGISQEWEAPPSFGNWLAGVVVNAKRVTG